MTNSTQQHRHTHRTTTHHHHHSHTHHLSTAAKGETGWIESIASLTEEHPATKLVASDAHQPASLPRNTNNTNNHSATVTTTTNSSSSSSNSKMTATNGACTLNHHSSDIQAAARSTHLDAGAAWEATLAFIQHELDRTGEIITEIGAPDGCGPYSLTEDDLNAGLEGLRASVDATKDAALTVVRRRSVSALRSGDPDAFAADVCIRRRPGTRPPIEVRVAIVGNVDSGKSTSVGVLTRSVLDDGRGSARAWVFKHGHEESTGRTSSIGQHNLCLDAQGGTLNDPQFRTTTIADYVARAAKVVTLVDLAGHEKYFKTTAYGLTGHLPDYACLIVGGNAGVVGMCKEHLGVALALRVPVFFVITKVDLAPAHVLQHTLTTLQTILKKPGVKKRPFVVRTMDDVVTCARHMHADSLAPIFLTSSVTGQGLDLVRLFYNLLPQRFDWAARALEHAEFVIDETFGVPGVGTVVAGTVKRGVISTSSSFLLGPDIGDGTFKNCQIKSIHYKRLPVAKVVAGQTAALALKKVKRHQVRKGMVLVAEVVRPTAAWEFDADIAILTHSTTIQPKYQAVIHCEIVRQSASVVAMDKELLRSGDRAWVRFRFMQHPEYLTPGTRFVFREGRTKGIGVVMGMVAPEDEAAPAR